MSWRVRYNGSCVGALLPPHHFVWEILKIDCRHNKAFSELRVRSYNMYLPDSVFKGGSSYDTRHRNCGSTAAVGALQQ